MKTQIEPILLVPAVLVAVSLVLGCGSETSGETVMHRDSLGVLITETRTPRWGGESPWKINETPMLDLSETGSGAEHEFHRVSDALRLRDGSIAVAERGSNQVRLFSSTGDFLRSVGRTGEGPGEFDRLTSVHELSDGSIVAFDPWLGRMSRFSRELELMGTRRPHDSTIRVREVHPLDEDTMVGVTWSLDFLTDVVGRYRVPYTIVRFGLTTPRVDTLLTVQGSEGYSFELGDARPIFSRDGHLAVHGGRLYIGEADSLEVRVYELGSGLVQVIRVPGFSLAVSPDDVKAERENLLYEQAPQPLRDAVMNMAAPATRAAYSDLLVDSKGFVWAPEAKGVGASGPVNARVFSPEGEWLGEIALPDRFRVFQIGEDFILGVRLDEFDVERVQMLALDRRE